MAIFVFLLLSFLQIGVGESQSLPEYDCMGIISGVCRDPESCMNDFMYNCPIPGSLCCPEFIGNSTTEVISEEVDDYDDDSDEDSSEESDEDSDEESSEDFDDQLVNNMTRFAGRRTASGCKPSPECAVRSGYCVTNKNECDGQLIKKHCKGPKCLCCISSIIPGDCPLTGTTGYPCNKPQSCAGYGNDLNGIYEICPISTCPPVKVRCMDDGWTVVLNRDLKNKKRCNFVRDWNGYKSGFCNPSGEYWLGNVYMYYLTGGRSQYYHMEITGITSSGNMRTLKYSYFLINNEAYKYQIDVRYLDSTSTGPDLFYSTPNSNIQINGHYFTTYDRDNDNLVDANCCSRTGNGGWWYNSCSGIVATKNSEILWYFWNAGEYGPENVERLYMRIKPH